MFRRERDDVYGALHSRVLTLGSDRRRPGSYARSAPRLRPALVRRIEGGAALEEKDDEGYTALIYAAKAGQGAAVNELLRRGADPRD